jgi:hypothetical protein
MRSNAGRATIALVASVQGTAPGRHRSHEHDVGCVHVTTCNDAAPLPRHTHVRTGGHLCAHAPPWFQPAVVRQQLPAHASTKRQYLPSYATSFVQMKDSHTFRFVFKAEAPAKHPVRLRAPPTGRAGHEHPLLLMLAQPPAATHDAYM